MIAGATNTNSWPEMIHIYLEAADDGQYSIAQSKTRDISIREERRLVVVSREGFSDVFDYGTIWRALLHAI